jgi:cytidylate kinase
MSIIAKIKRLFRWIYRDSDTGKFISKADFDVRDRRMTQRERVNLRDEGDSM